MSDKIIYITNSGRTLEGKEVAQLLILHLQQFFYRSYILYIQLNSVQQRTAIGIHFFVDRLRGLQYDF